LHAPDHLPDYALEQSNLWQIVKDHARPIVLGLMILIGGTVATYVLNYMAASPSFAATLVNGLFGLIASLAGGWLSDVVGRRWMMIVPRVLFFIAAYPVFVLIVDERSTTALLTGTALLSILLNISTGAFYVGFTELLPKRVRGVVFATVYATAISLFGGTTQIFVAWLMHVTGNNLAMSWYLLFATAECMFAMEETAPVRLAREPAA